MAQDDTLVSGVAGRYASALFALAQDNRQAEAVAQSLAKLDQLVAGNPDLERLVRSPVFSTADQLKALDAILAKEDIGGVTANFVRLVTVKRRLFSIRDMIAAYRKLYGEYRVKPAAQQRLGEILARVETTAPPTAKKGGR